MLRYAVGGGAPEGDEMLVEMGVRMRKFNDKKRFQGVNARGRSGDEEGDLGDRPEIIDEEQFGIKNGSGGLTN